MFVVLKSKDYLTAKHREQLMVELDRLCPKGKNIVLEGGMQLEVVNSKNVKRVKRINLKNSLTAT